MTNIERVKNLIENFKSKHGNVKVIPYCMPNVKDMLYIKIVDKDESCWFFSQLECENTEYKDILGKIAKQLGEYSVGQELAAKIELNFNSKSCTSYGDYLFTVAKEVDNTIFDLGKYINAHHLRALGTTVVIDGEDADEEEEC